MTKFGGDPHFATPRDEDAYIGGPMCLHALTLDDLQQPMMMLPLEKREKRWANLSKVIEDSIMGGRMNISSI